jgi:hypothetical protein
MQVFAHIGLTISRSSRWYANLPGIALRDAICLALSWLIRDCVALIV